MVEKNIDITGEVCPFCLLVVRKEMKTINSGDVLIVKCDHPPAVNVNIPAAMKKEGHDLTIKLLEPGLWELKITKK